MESLQGEVEALQTELRSMEGHLREKDRGDVAKETKIKELEVCCYWRWIPGGDRSRSPPPKTFSGGSTEVSSLTES